MSTKATTDPEAWERKLRQNREYRKRKKEGKAYQPRKYSEAFLAKQVGKNIKAQPTKKEDYCEESYKRKLEVNRAYRARKKAKDPEAYKAELRKVAIEYWAKLSPAKKAEKSRKRQQWRIRTGRAGYGPVGKPLAASVMHCAAPSQWRDVMLEIANRVGYCNEREDIISEALLFNLEGFTIADAVAQAKRKVNYEVNAVQRNLNIENMENLL